MGFAEVFAHKRGRGKIALRRASFELAKKSAAMNIFLCKNFLGMRDSIEYSDKEALAKLDAVLAEIKGVE